ncbi:hypothetical protein [Thaumasiovibrio subtropicus]|uniref:hypothetical protein n=1 Tax=Thaumasiovibrio subtropicus TaxID=1891207 RepID=UPI000B35DBB5|nr:hypothetical protein [Thaumasiovibrio subtropicus]
MSIRALVTHQREGYARFHAHKGNFWIHLLTVPCFNVGFYSGIYFIIDQDHSSLVLAGAAMISAIAMQGIGHKQEVNPPEAFTGLGNAVVRVLLEQLYTFPRFVVSGHWPKNRS